MADEQSVTIDVDECVGCGLCVDACPNDVLDLVDDVATVVDEDACVQCYICIDECPNDCISQ